MSARLDRKVWVSSSTIHATTATGIASNPVYHATGVRIRELPIRLEKLLDAPTITL